MKRKPLRPWARAIRVHHRRPSPKTRKRWTIPFRVTRFDGLNPTFCKALP